MRDSSNRRAVPAYTSPEPRPRPWRLLATLDWHTNLAAKFGATHDAILLYHSVGGLSGTDYRWDIPTTVFREQIRVITERYDVVDLATLVREPDPERKRVAVTFDDGFRNIYANAVPVLREFDVPATVFLCPRYIGDNDIGTLRDRHGLAQDTRDIVMTESQIQALGDDELFSLGNHTQSHQKLTDLGTREAIESEVVVAKEALERRFGVTVDQFSYPYGAVDESVATVVDSSHDIAVTSAPNLLDSDTEPTRLPRLDACQPAAVMAFELSDVAHRLRSLAR